MIFTKTEENGFSTLEYVVALIIVMIAFVSWLSLLSTGVRNGTFVKRVADVNALSSSKATELIKQSETIIQAIPTGETTIGSIAPNPLIQGYFDYLDEFGKVLVNNVPPDELGIRKRFNPKYTRQWQVFKDYPRVGDVSVLVSVFSNDTNKLVRLTKLVRPKGRALAPQDKS